MTFEMIGTEKDYRYIELILYMISIISMIKS